MAEIKNSFIGSKMNKDLDERLIPSNEYRDALNVAVSRSEGSDVGSLEAILGNIKKVTLPTKEKIIGHLVDESNNVVYYFTTDFTPATTTEEIASNNKCTISMYSASSGNSSVLVSGYWLNFSTTSRMNGVSLIENLLFFSDNRNQPRKINVTTAASDPNYYFNEDQISVAKFAPYKAPEFVNLRSTNQLKPSTMSDASDPLQTEIGVSTYSSVNLDVSTYKNGDAIPRAQTPAEWTTFNNNQQGAWCYYDNDLANGVVYGKLYNYWAIADTRGLAPNGFSIMSSADWTDITDATGTPATRLKSQELWDANPGTDTTGFDALPAGFREHTANVNAFQQLTTKTRFWTSESLVAGKGKYVEMVSTAQTLTQSASGDEALPINGYSVRLKRNAGYNGWNGDPDYLTDKFVRFSYRFKFDDNEYSVIAPFSQDVFIPQQEGEFLNEDETQAFVTTVVGFMQNSVNNAVLNIELPSLNILQDYKIKAIDIIFKESDTQAYQVLESVTVDSSFISDLNNTNIFQYEYQSTLPIKTLPATETTRVFDKVPVTARAQATSGNRIMYGNYVEGKSGQSGLDYFVDVADKNNIVYTEYPQHSLKQNRNYQVGVVLADKFGRQTDVILSNYDNLLDANGNPQPGSNVFSDYNTVGFNEDVPAWNGDGLRINFNSIIPESVNANNVSGYPGAYAVGNYYTITTGSLNYPIFFRDWSTQEITAIANQNVFDFTGLVYADIAPTSNTFNVYRNQNEGWIKLTLTTDYLVTDNGGKPRVTLKGPVTSTNLTSLITQNTANGTNGDYTGIVGTTSGFTTNSATGTGVAITVTIAGNAATAVVVTADGSGFLPGDKIIVSNSVIGGSANVEITLNAASLGSTNVGDVIKAELLYTTNNYYKYTTGTTNAAQPLFANFATTYQDFFAVGKSLPGKYIDYTTIKSVTPSGNPVVSVSLYTDYEVAEKYLFDQTGTGRPEPALLIADLPRIYATYDINVDGFYSYRIGVKQKQQDYYNVYLPGIVNGYPIQGETKELGETAFVTLISDNINKVPRNLQDVGPLQNQFTSDIKLFGRVTNTVNSTSNPKYYNTQFDPLSSPDSVNLVGTVKDVFPGVADAPSNPGNIESNCIYDYNTKPYIAKIATQKTIGIPETAYNNPSGSYPYPGNMGLAVYETSPFVSQLELFYEATTTGLISDLNYDIQNIATGINGISVTYQEFSEDYATGTRVTEDFFPLSGGQIVTTATAELISIFNYNSTPPHDLNLINYAEGGNQKFNLLPGSQTGSYYIATTDTFYAGGPSEPDFYTQYAGKFLVTIKYTEASGETVNQTMILQLTNAKPVATPGFPPMLGPSPGSNAVLYNQNTSPQGYNGSATPAPSSTNAGNSSNATFDPGNGFGWSVVEARKYLGSSANPQTVWTTYMTGAGYPVKLTNSGVVNGSALRFEMSSNGTNGIQQGYRYEIDLQLTDTSGAVMDQVLTVSWSLGVTTFSNVVSAAYTSGTGYTTNDTTMVSNANMSSSNTTGLYPRFIGQFQNWSDSTQHLYARLKWTSGTNNGFIVRAGNVTYADTFNGGNQKIGERLDTSTGGLVGATQIASSTSAGEYWIKIAQLDGFMVGLTTPQKNTQLNAGVRPGQKNLGGLGTLPVYDYKNCALVNFAISIEGAAPANNAVLPPNVRNSLSGYSGVQLQLWYSTTSQVPGSTAPPNATQISSTQTPALPFYPATVNQTNFAVSPTATGTSASQGPIS